TPLPPIFISYDEAGVMWLTCLLVTAATTPRGESGWSKLRRKGRMAADGMEASPGTPRSPTVFDWCVGFKVQTEYPLLFSSAPHHEPKC
uniref:Uncharacterized protein n=1 Tax=Aegilops tauschii subsp. strangulata TaxID=200361 RepID=A0A453KUY4_AEGTS